MYILKSQNDHKREMVKTLVYNKRLKILFLKTLFTINIYVNAKIKF